MNFLNQNRAFPKSTKDAKFVVLAEGKELTHDFLKAMLLSKSDKSINIFFPNWTKCEDLNSKCDKLINF